MRTILALALTALLLAPIAASAESEPLWEVARKQADAGTFGGLTIALGEGADDTSISMQYGDMPSIVEVYTATWCSNCVTSEHAMEEVLSGIDAVHIHYHRHFFEIEDPFGSNSTEERWEAVYGESSTAVGGGPRLAPTSIIDGERMHIGSSPKGESLIDDYTWSMAVGSTAWFVGGAIEFGVSFEAEAATFSWSLDDLVFSCADDCPEQQTTAWLMFVEDSAHFSEGSNNLEDYLHVLHEAIALDSDSGSLSVDVPTAWDGDDMKAILLVDWKIVHDGARNPNPLPAAGLSTLLSLLAAVPVARHLRED